MAMKVIVNQLKAEIMQEKFNQFIFARQLKELRSYANEKGIQMLGDMPIFVSQDSVDAWANQHLFKLDHEGRPIYVAGVPPDYFSATGQLWGNPQYDWAAMKADGYDWWIKRIKRIAEQVNIVRIDHFRGFEAYWEVPADAKTAIGGRWVKGPGKALFAALEQKLGQLSLVAEDLGVITPEVEALREELGYPGMKVLQFALAPEADGRLDFLPQENSVAYTGTHDNNTTRGWFRDDIGDELRAGLLQRCDVQREQEAAGKMIQLVYESPARLAIVPMQDILALGAEARMNLPGTVGGTSCPFWNTKWHLSGSGPDGTGAIRIADGAQLLLDANNGGDSLAVVEPTRGKTVYIAGDGDGRGAIYNIQNTER